MVWISNSRAPEEDPRHRREGRNTLEGAHEIKASRRSGATLRGGTSNPNTCRAKGAPLERAAVESLRCLKQASISQACSIPPTAQQQLHAQSSLTSSKKHPHESTRRAAGFCPTPYPPSHFLHSSSAASLLHSARESNARPGVLEFTLLLAAAAERRVKSWCRRGRGSDLVPEGDESRGTPSHGFRL